MNEKPVSLKTMEKAFQRLGELLPRKTTLLMGGGGAMIMAHKYPLATTDVDVIPKGLEVGELDAFVKQIALEQGLPGDWLNPYFSTFLHTLPMDYRNRLVPVFQSGHLAVEALGATDMLVLKCFAGRPKDIGHARALVRKGADTEVTSSHIESLGKKRVAGAQKALDFLDSILELES